MAINSFKVKNSLNVAPQATAPSSPALGDVYVDLLGNYFRWSGTAWTSLGSAGSGGINYLINSNKAWNFDDGASTGWGVYADAAGVAPVDGTGGSPNVTFAASATTPLRGAYSGLFTKDAANRQGQGVSVDFTLDTQDIGKPFTFSFDTSASASFTGVSGTESARVYCYDVTNAALLPGYVDISPGSSTTKGFFLATSSTSYRFIIHVSGTGTSAWTLKIDNVIVGQQTVTQGNAITDVITVPYSAGNFTSNAGSWDVAAGDVNNYQYQRVGNQMVLEVALSGINVTGTVSELYLKVPAGVTIGTSTRTFSTYSDNGTPVVVLVRAVSGETNVRITKLAGGNFSTTANNSDFMFQFIFPIAEWSSNITMADRAVEEFAYNTSTSTSASDTTSFANGAVGAQIQNITAALARRVRFQTPILPTDSIIVEVKPPGSNVWLRTDARDETNNALGYNFQYQNGATYGVGQYRPVSGSNTDIDVSFGQYLFPSAGYGAAGQAWSAGGAFAGGAAFWRVRKIAAGGLVGYGAAKIPTTTTLTTGSGTYTTPAGAVRLRVRMVGGGGAGGGTTNGTGGGNTTFGTLTCNGGNGTSGTTAGAGGNAVAVGAGFSGVSLVGSSGGAGTAFNGTNNLIYAKGGDGGPSAFGGQGGGGDSNVTGGSGGTNTGSGGGGGGIKNIGSGTPSGAGGGSGSYVDVVSVGTIASTYSYAVGGGGTGGGTNSSVFGGGAGGSGIIIVEEFYI